MGGPSRYGASMRVEIAVSSEMRNVLKSLQEGKTLLVAPFDTPPKDSSAKLPRCHASLDKAQLCDPHMQVVYTAECEGCQTSQCAWPTADILGSWCCKRSNGARNAVSWSLSKSQSKVGGTSVFYRSVCAGPAVEVLAILRAVACGRASTSCCRKDFVRAKQGTRIVFVLCHKTMCAAHGRRPDRTSCCKRVVVCHITIRHDGLAGDICRDAGSVLFSRKRVAVNKSSRFTSAFIIVS